MSRSALHGLLLRLDPESAHEIALRGLRLAQVAPGGLAGLRSRYRVGSPEQAQHLLGLRFENPIGLAAGFDKNGEAIGALAALGFGFVEVGTVTPMPQRGNPRPRIFRCRQVKSLQNALGFNNHGQEALAATMRRQGPFPVPVGINIGKNKKTPSEGAAADYEALAEGLSEWCDYFVINVSSPNTPGLRGLQDRRTLGGLVDCCRAVTNRPVFVKLAPDLSDTDAVELSGEAVAKGAAGIILTNTTIDYSLIPEAREVGGLSGTVLKKRSLELLRIVAAELYGECLLVSVGGVDSAAEAYSRLQAGASLIQVYTAMVYEGPSLISEIVRGIRRLMQRDGVVNIEDVIGASL